MPNLVIIGGGILGTTLAYWLSTVYDGAQITVIEKEDDLARHMSGRNTGVIHRPFYLDPEKKRVFAEAVQHSYLLWKSYATARKLPWREVGTMEVALDEMDVRTLETYLRWASANGIPEGEVTLLSNEEARRLEPNVVCTKALLSKTDVAVDFGLFTKALRHDAEERGVSFAFGADISSIIDAGSDLVVRAKDGRSFSARYLVNCAGGNSLALANLMGVAKNLTALNFRGEYWSVTAAKSHLASRNIYSVPRHPEMPFLDPHWIVRSDGRVDIGPTAVPVIGPYTYDGFAPDAGSFMKAVPHLFHPNLMRLFGSAEFWKLAATEWKSSFSRSEMANRVQRFIPKLTPADLVERGSSGVRSSVVGPDGRFVKEVIEEDGPKSLHILNYNSPGATGAPAYTARLMKKLLAGGAGEFLVRRPRPMPAVWDYRDIEPLI